jgi:hypothetical protein
MNKSPIPQYYDPTPVMIKKVHEPQQKIVYNSIGSGHELYNRYPNAIRSGGYANQNIKNLQQPRPPQVYSRL